MSGARGQREIGSVGTAARIVGGVILLGVAVLPGGLSVWDVVGGVVAGPPIAFAAAAAVRTAAVRAGLADRTPWSAPSLATLGLVIAAMTVLTFLTPLDQPAIWVFLGASMLAAA